MENVIQLNLRRKLSYIIEVVVHLTERLLQNWKSYRSVSFRADASLCTWNKELAKKESPTSDALESREREELHHLRRENKRLQMESEIIKKAMVFFARD